jgi:hypothetical protein
MPPAPGRPGWHAFGMRHARGGALDDLEDLLGSLRDLPLREKSRGTFYRGGRAFLHFHEDPTGLFADVRLNPAGEFERVRVTTAEERQRLLDLIRATPG